MTNAKKTVVVPHDVPDRSDASGGFLFRKGDRITPAAAKRHGIIPIESSPGPRLDSKASPAAVAAKAGK